MPDFLRDVTSQRSVPNVARDGTNLVLDPGAADALDGRQSFRRFIQVVVEFDQGDGKRTIALAPLGTRRMSLPTISAAQQRDSRGNYCLAALLRSFVSLLVACPQGS